MTWQGVATSVVALAAFCTALGVLSRLKPMKWLWSKNVKDPLGSWLGNTIDERLEAKLEPIRAELSFNGGTTTKDAVARVETAVARLEANDKVKLTRLDSIDAAVALHIDKFHTKET